MLAACSEKTPEQEASLQSNRDRRSRSDCDEVGQGRKTKDSGELSGMVWIPGGRFIMGEDAYYPEEFPQREVVVPGFWIDRTEVTNAEFAKFVEATGYRTVAERPVEGRAPDGVDPKFFKPGSAVFTPPNEDAPLTSFLDWWSYVPGASWKAPQGPESDIVERGDFPVVHIAYEDAVAYAEWAGLALPSEAQWEYAAQMTAHVSGDGTPIANTWQGLFPVQNRRGDGFAGIAPVGCFPANRYGLYDMIGNVWEWTSSVYEDARTPIENNLAGQTAHRVIKGGSYLCAENYCMRYRPAARHAQETGMGTNHIGFRTVDNNRPAPPQ